MVPDNPDPPVREYSKRSVNSHSAKSGESVDCTLPHDLGM